MNAFFLTAVMVVFGADQSADTESAEALPMRTWSDASGAFSVEAQFVELKEGKVTLKKANGRIIAVPLARFSDADQKFALGQGKAKQDATKPGARGTVELSHDNGAMADKRSIAGGGHAVRFKVKGDSWCVTSVSLHGSRYGEPRPPKENFKVWICDAQFAPIATFEFPYGSYTRGTPAWKNFRIRPTRVPEEFMVCFGFDPQQTKGVYVGHDGKPGETSMIGVPGEGEPKPFEQGNWLIRCKVEKRAENEK